MMRILTQRKISLATEGFTTTKFCELGIKRQEQVIQGKCPGGFKLYHSNEKGD
jgi:hypothetical protein